MRQFFKNRPRKMWLHNSLGGSWDKVPDGTPAGIRILFFFKRLLVGTQGNWFWSWMEILNMH